MRRSSACRSASGTGCSATSTSPRRSAGATSPSRTRRSSSPSPPRRASRSRTPGCTTRPRSAQRWLAATAEITALLTAGRSGVDALQTIADRAREVAGADVAWILDGRGPAFLMLRVMSGVEADSEAMRALPLERSLAGVVVDTGSPVSVEDIATDPRALDLSQLFGWPSLGPAVVVPLRSGEQVDGALALAWSPGAGRAVLHPGPGAARRASPSRPRWRCRSPGPARTSSAWRSSRTATGSAATCTTWSSSGCSRSGWGCRATARLVRADPSRLAARPGRRRPRRHDQGHPPLDLRPRRARTPRTTSRPR